jgi:serine protease Do
MIVCLLLTGIGWTDTGYGQVKLAKTSIQTLSGLSANFEMLSESVSPAIVQILSTGYTPGRSDADNVLTKQVNTGSGVVLDPAGYIVTNAHVVAGARRIQVAVLNKQPEDETQSILKPRSKLVGAQLIGLDTETDLAVLKIQEKNLPFLQLGDSEEVKKGQIVFAFGSPLGLENSATMGIVSSVARQLRTEDPMIYIQTDAPINPGNSGGPLVNIDGLVVGINTMIFSQSGGNEGIGFAAPSNIVKNIYQQLRTTGRVQRGTIGVYVQTITPILAEGLGLPDVGRVVIADVAPYSPAAAAGLRTGDIVLKLDSKPMENGRQLIVNIYNKKIDSKVLIEIQRGTVNKVVQVTIAERPEDPERFVDMVSPERNLVPPLGILGLDLNDMIRQMLPPLREDSGVVVANRANLMYDQDQFMPGDVIHTINKQPVKTLEELRQVAKNLKKYDAVVAQVERFGQLRYIAFEME